MAGSFNPVKPFTAFTTESSPQTVDWASTFLQQLAPVLPRGSGTVWNGKVAMSAWHVNPYSWGAYSYWPVGYCHLYAGYERVRQGAVHFAGEHCSVDFQGYMEGGATEGQRAAVEVLGDYGLK